NVCWFTSNKTNRLFTILNRVVRKLNERLISDRTSLRIPEATTHVRIPQGLLSSEKKKLKKNIDNIALQHQLHNHFCGNITLYLCIKITSDEEESHESRNVMDARYEDQTTNARGSVYALTSWTRKNDNKLGKQFDTSTNYRPKG
ncbi:hypothetical protein C0J52_11525, partial [Blattella germanica]